MRKIATVIVFWAMLSIGCASTGGLAEPSESRPPDLTVWVAGMTCPFCANGMEKQFRKTDKVQQVRSAWAEGEFQVWLIDGARLEDAQVEDAVGRAGFTLRKIER